MPRQHSSGGKPTLLGISKRGDVYLRTLLIHGARSAILAAQRKAVSTERWLAETARAAQSEHRGRGAGQQERSHRLGAAGAWTGVPARLRYATARRIERQTTDNDSGEEIKPPIAQAITQ